jgi:1-acyl-sn-glycerol-3-phosphate acyltransferase
VIVLRSILFNILFYILLIVYLIAAIPTFAMPPPAIRAVARHWGRANLVLLRLICGTTVEWRGLDKIPLGPLLVAAKHQSMWETFALATMFPDFAYIMKRELMWIPFFGWYTWKAGMIGIDRSGGKLALAAMNARAHAALAQGRQIIIFPEGTRRPAGAEPQYKYGIAHLYAGGSTPCLPVALNSGLFWPRRKFLRYPGTIIVEFLDPIPPGLDRDVFFERLQRDLEAATGRLIAEGVAGGGQLG